MTFQQELSALVEQKYQQWQEAKRNWETCDHNSHAKVTKAYGVYQGAQAALELYKSGESGESVEEAYSRGYADGYDACQDQA